MEKKYLLVFTISVVICIIFGSINFYFIKKDTKISSSIYIGVLIVASTPIIVMKFLEQRKLRELERIFPQFLRDFIEAVRSGMTIPQAFNSVSSNNYGILTPYVKKMVAQLDWGIPVEKVLIKFSKETKSKLIGRIISSVIEAHRFGGNLADTFDSLSRTALEIEKLRGERMLYMNSQLITGYIIFFVFLGVMVALDKFLVPNIGQTTLPGSETALPAQQTTTSSSYQESFRELFRNLILIQGLFAGLMVGKMSEGAMISGIKHSIIMMVVGISVFLLFG